jgi:hypothetical protein
MARTPSEPSQRIARLVAARKHLKRGEVLNGEEMAAAAGMTWRQMKPLIDNDRAWPIKQRGYEGVAWQFEPRKVIDHMIRQDRAKLAESVKRRDRLTAMAGVEVEKGSDYSLSELREIDRLQESAHRRKIEQNKYMLREEVETLFANYAATVQTELLAIPSVKDPAGQWPPEIRLGVVDGIRDGLVRAHDAAGELITRNARQ